MWHSTSYTDTGKIRDHNEDAVLELGSESLWLVADGMGGHSYGDYASQLVAQVLSKYRTSKAPGICKQRLVNALTNCNSRLIEKARQDDVDVIGCTVAALQARAHSVLCSWSGDSRIYRFRDGILKQLTQDHSQQSAMDDRDCLRFPMSYPVDGPEMLTHAVGANPSLTIEHCWYCLIPGDSYLLCTDGLNKEVSDDEICRCLSHSSNGHDIVEQLVNTYLNRGAKDNIGIVWLLNKT